MWPSLLLLRYGSHYFPKAPAPPVNRIKTPFMRVRLSTLIGALRDVLTNEKMNPIHPLRNRCIQVPVDTNKIPGGSQAFGWRFS